jgi:peptidoglycan hydrolase-like protein with peptidoglycan-binding domain
LKQRLRQLGFDPGSRDERMDDGTRAAIAAFAMKNGAPAAFMPGVLTVNLMNAIAEAPPR